MCHPPSILRGHKNVDDVIIIERSAPFSRATMISKLCRRWVYQVSGKRTEQPAWTTTTTKARIEGDDEYYHRLLEVRAYYEENI